MVPAFIRSRIRRPAHSPFIAKGTLPVVFFGDVEQAKVVTVSLNPSHKEFYRNEGFLPRARCSLATLRSMGVESPEVLTDEQTDSVYLSCRNYFAEEASVYKIWFGPMDRLLREGLGVSYYDGSCCHVDLVQWATDPFWGRLPADARRQLLDQDLPFLRAMLENYPFRLLVFNGKSALEAFKTYFKPELGATFIPRSSDAKIIVEQGTLTLGSRLLPYLGWNKYIHYGFPAPDRKLVTQCLRALKSGADPGPTES